MKRSSILFGILSLLVLLLSACNPASKVPTAVPQTPQPPGPSPTAWPTDTPPVAQEPTMEECRQWLASSQELAAPIACPDWTFFRDELFKRGGGVFPVGDDRYYLVWFPDDWEHVTDRKVIVSLHGTGGCAEWMLNHWYQTSTAEHTWALTALQYYDPRSKQYDDDAVIYQNLQALWADLQGHCPVAGSAIFYHGFSRGSAQSFAAAIHDRAGKQLFAAFIADSGCAGLNYPTLRDAPTDALAGARFWLWCGENDVSTVDPNRMTCDVMEEDMRPYVEEHGGQVDALIREEGAAHGMFSGCTTEDDAHCTPRKAGNLGPSLPRLFEYITRLSTQPTSLPPTAAPPPEGGAAPTMEDCRAWIQGTHSLDYPDHGCEEHSDILNSVADGGGGIIPLQDSKFFIARFPDNWDSLTDRTLIVTLHGSGGCAERLYRWWSRPAAEHNYALVALQYARADASAEEGYAFDDAEQIYASLRTVFDELQTHCPLDDTVVVYHGFSRGSARSFEIALLDRADAGMKLFTAFIADSGTTLADTSGEIPAYLQEAAPDAYSGARFWLYCGGADHDGQTCEDMKRIGPLLEEHGATVDTYRYEPGGHGIFATVKPGEPPSEAVAAMYEFIDNLRAQP